MTVENFAPYRFEPVLRQGADYRLTFVCVGPLPSLSLRLDGVEYPFVADPVGNTVEVVVPWDRLEDVPDKARASVIVKTGDVTELLFDGYVVRG